MRSGSASATRPSVRSASVAGARKRRSTKPSWTPFRHPTRWRWSSRRPRLETAVAGLCPAIWAWISGGKSRYIGTRPLRAASMPSDTFHLMSQPATSQPAAPSTDARAAKLSIGFINWAHALDHYVMLIFATAVIGLAVVDGRSYSEWIAFSTPAFFAFGLFSLPAGWLADRWSRRNMMAVFYIGCGLSLLASGLAPAHPLILAAALFAIGVFASIYHPVGTAMLIAQATVRGRSLAFNGVCGNLGVALAPAITALIVYGFGWRSAFLVPGLVCLVTAAFYLSLVSAAQSNAAG